jgi:hypothetical protein
MHRLAWVKTHALASRKLTPEHDVGWDSPLEISPARLEALLFEVNTCERLRHFGSAKLFLRVFGHFIRITCVFDHLIVHFDEKIFHKKTLASINQSFFSHLSRKLINNERKNLVDEIIRLFTATWKVSAIFNRIASQCHVVPLMASFFGRHTHELW